MKRLFYFFSLLITTLCFCQNTLVPKNITSQFDDLYRKSSTYKGYKVISISKYDKLKNNTLDSLNSQKEIIEQKTLSINKNQQEIIELKQTLKITEDNLTTAIDLKDRRHILGITVSKSTLSYILVATYSFLILLLGFFIFKYKQNLSITKKATSSLKELEIEFEDHKKNALGRFQEINRKLQDELNKNWKKDK